MAAGGVATLPLELECPIFELAALFRPVSIPNMIRVAWRVKHWVEPLLYRTIIIWDEPIDGFPACDVETFTHAAQTKPASFFLSVRNVIAISVEPEILRTIIRLCPRIENLFMLPNRDLHSSVVPIPPGFDDLPLKRLHCDLDRVFDLASTLTLVTHPSLLHLTHLELADGLDREGDSDDEALARWKMLADLPRLSHLALNISRNDLHVCVHLLIVCKSLRALIILRHPPPGESAEMDDLADNPRFVMAPLENYIADWQRGVLYGNDFWARADELIAKRLSGEVDRRNFFLEDTS
ncbi:hypothetical protein MVEN_02297900 [Mycena venus]|uniref:Uncharacterized protein n=1 Tax=Mycena venus TaxID=2733690 RepID=A0A8H7CEJ0_9AGAR|nr:hypothetical protein MVEN_02297900 [Mycena venus]